MPAGIEANFIHYENGNETTAEEVSRRLSSPRCQLRSCSCYVLVQASSLFSENITCNRFGLSHRQAFERFSLRGYGIQKSS